MNKYDVDCLLNRELIIHFGFTVHATDDDKMVRLSEKFNLLWTRWLVYE